MTIEVIAEAGINHSGNFDIALRMIDAAKAAGADTVKFQTFVAQEAINVNHKDFSFLSALALPLSLFPRLARRCEDVGIQFLSTPGDLSSLKCLVEECGVKRLKIGSDDLTYTPLIQAAAKTRLPVILSTGMATMKEIATAVDYFRPAYDGWSDVTLLHCVSSYPCAPEDANLLAIGTLASFDTFVGYSDHCTGYLACLAATALGATIVEKHFILKDRPGPDSVVSIDEHELASLITLIHAMEPMRGTGEKVPCAMEKELIPVLRKREDGKKMA